MLIERKSRYSGNVNTRDIDVTVEQLEEWQGGVLIQIAMPHLSPNDREFLMSGMTPEEWDEMTAAADDSRPEEIGEEE